MRGQPLARNVCLQVKKDSYKTLWKDDLSTRGRILDIHWTPPNYLDGHLYAFSGRNPPDAMFKCVELATGKVKWEWRSYFYRGSMIYSDGHFIAMGEFGDLALLKLSPAGHKELTASRERQHRERHSRHNFLHSGPFLSLCAVTEW